MAEVLTVVLLILEMLATLGDFHKQFYDIYINKIESSP